MDHPRFETKFAGLHEAVLNHAAYEENDEFPMLRQVLAPEHLVDMAQQLLEVQRQLG